MSTGTPGATTAKAGEVAEIVDLRALGLPRLVFALLRARFSGLLTLPQTEPEPGERTVWFQGGMPIFTDWVSPEDSLGQILVETGQLAAEERDRAAQALDSLPPTAARERFGHYLVRRRLLTTAQLRKALRVQCGRKLVHCFAVRRGEARVTGGESSEVDEHTLGAQVNALELIFAGVTRHYDLGRIAIDMARLFEAPLRVRSSLERYRAHFRFTPADEAVIAAFNPSATILEVAARSSESRLRVAQIAYTLWACQMLKGAQAMRDTSGAQAVVGAKAEGEPRPAARKASIGAGNVDPDRLAEFAAELGRLEAMVTAGGNAFELMGLPLTAGRAEVRAAWHGLSRRFHPDALAHQELGHLRERSAAVFASLNEAYQILSDTRQREELAALLRSGGRPQGHNTPAPTTQAILESEAIAREADKLLRAGNFERALERYRKAAELSPEDLELQVAIAWCEYQRSADKAPLRGPTEVTLRGVLSRQPRCARAHYFLGLLYMHASDDQAALAAFTAALEIEPEMLDAKRQIHAIELRGSTPPATDPRSSGVFRRRI
ncbi:MAG TPA: DUF4388 domain-containing protein [Nannocystis sp.]|jgi:tetratricopeptide (TPR) repeat protein